MDSHLLIIGDTKDFEATKEELQKLYDLQLMLKEYLGSRSATSHSEPVQQALAKFNSDQDFLMKFVRGRKLNIEKAVDSIVCYANIKYNVYPDLFPTQVPPFVDHVIEHGILSVLKHTDTLGRTVVIFRATKWDVTLISLEQIICAGRYITDRLMESPDYLRKGEILITDCKDASIQHARHFTIPTIVKFVNVFWKAYPIQIKGLYHVNAPFFVRPVFALVKPFLPTKLRDRVLITPGVTELHKRIEPDILPEYLGGTLQDDDATACPSFFRLHE